MGITDFLVNNIERFFEAAGYLSITILMALESMIAPVPSEAVMPPAGFLIAKGTFTFAGVIFFSTLGSMIGSLISYYIGAWGGRPIVEKYGRFLLLDKSMLDKSEKFFTKKGELTIFICRFVPVVRHLISIPAGIAKMNLLKFTIYTLVGAAMWNSFLAYVGYTLKSRWESVMKYSHIIDKVVVVLLVIVLIYYVYKFYKNFKGSKSI